MAERSSSSSSTSATPDAPSHLELLRLLEAHPEYSQRQLATELGISVGKAHYLLKALLDKGSVKMQTFQRSTHKLGYLYRLTPKGVAHRLQLTQRFLAKKEEEYVTLNRQIAALRAELATDGSTVHRSTGDMGPTP